MPDNKAFIIAVIVVSLLAIGIGAILQIAGVEVHQFFGEG